MAYDVPVQISIEGAKAVFEGKGLDLDGKCIDISVDGRIVVADRVRAAGQIAFHPPLELEHGRHVIVLTSQLFDDGLSAAGSIELDLMFGVDRTVSNRPTSRQPLQ